MRVALTGGRVIDPSIGRDLVTDVFVDDGVVVPSPSDPAAFGTIDCTGCVVSPAFVDLHAPHGRADALADAGFGVAVLGPVEHPSEVRVERGSHVDLLVAGALTVGLAGDEIADVGLLVRAGARVLSNGTNPLRNARVLRNVLEYVGRLGVPVMMRAADVDLEAGGVVREGPRAAWLGLPSVPPEAEELGIATVAAIVRRTGTRVHLTHLWSARGVEALARAQREGLPVTASTTPHHLALSDALIDEHAYAGCCRFVPPLGDDADRRALCDAVRDGTIAAVATDHRLVPLHLQDREIELAEPGTSGLSTAFALVYQALGRDLVATIRALSTGPAAILGVRPRGFTIIEPGQEFVVDKQTNSPLAGRTVVGRAALAGRE